MDIVQQRGTRESSPQRTSRTVTLYNSLRWIPFHNEAYIKRCELAYKQISGTLPDYLNVSLKKTPMLTQEPREIVI